MSDGLTSIHNRACLEVLKLYVVTHYSTTPAVWFAFDLSVWMFGVVHDASDVVTWINLLESNEISAVLTSNQIQSWIFPKEKLFVLIACRN